MQRFSIHFHLNTHFISSIHFILKIVNDDSQLLILTAIIQNKTNRCDQVSQYVLIRSRKSNYFFESLIEHQWRSHVSGRWNNILWGILNINNLDTHIFWSSRWFIFERYVNCLIFHEWIVFSPLFYPPVFSSRN